LEAFTHTDEGAIYAITDCPQHEDPLNLMPHALRQDFRDATGIQIEGELCPMCALNVQQQYQDDIYRVPVKRLYFSEKERVGIGTFVPSDPKSQDISELVGSIDLSTIGDYGSESDPRAYRFDGELNIANRGLMEFIEMLKADERFLYVLEFSKNSFPRIQYIGICLASCCQA
jgi:serine protein kinase